MLNFIDSKISNITFNKYHFTTTLDASGHLKLADFGLSKIVSPIASSGFDPSGPVDEEDFRNASATVAINLIKSILPLKVSQAVLNLEFLLFVIFLFFPLLVIVLVFLLHFIFYSQLFYVIFTSF